jgi:excinuclease ABC subunit C
MTYEDYRNIMDTLPKDPGVYRYIGKEGDILYVGKAKNLKNRISSYFTAGKNLVYRTRVMIKNADHVEFTIVDTEHDALLLENTLIKKHQPRYNVNLKDGKSYTYICVKNERFPRVFFTRRVIKDGSEYFGPYTSKFKAKIVLEMIKSLFPLRTCKYNLSEENIRAGKFKVCLEYHIKNCLGPCEDLESEQEYNEKIGQVKNMLRGQFTEVTKHLRSQMRRHAENLEFEKAQQAKVRLDAFSDYQSKSTVVSAKIEDVDVFAMAETEKIAYVSYIKVIKGAVINTYTIEMVKNLNEDKEDLLSLAVVHLREKFNSIAPEIIVPVDVTTSDDRIKMTVPQRGEKRHLLGLAEKNAEYFMKQMKRDEATRQGKKGHAERILTTLKNDLQMEEVPLHLECFDNSNLGGSSPVA